MNYYNQSNNYKKRIVNCNNYFQNKNKMLNLKNLHLNNYLFTFKILRIS